MPWKEVRQFFPCTSSTRSLILRNACSSSLFRSASENSITRPFKASAAFSKNRMYCISISDMFLKGYIIFPLTHALRSIDERFSKQSWPLAYCRAVAYKWYRPCIPVVEHTRSFDIEPILAGKRINLQTRPLLSLRSLIVNGSSQSVPPTFAFLMLFLPLESRLLKKQDTQDGQFDFLIVFISKPWLIAIYALLSDSPL